MYSIQETTKYDPNYFIVLKDGVTVHIADTREEAQQYITLRTTIDVAESYGMDTTGEWWNK